MPVRTEARAPVRAIPTVQAHRMARKKPTSKSHPMHPGGQWNRTTTKAKKQTTTRTPGVRAQLEIKKYQSKRVDPELLVRRARLSRVMMDIKEDYANFPEGIKISAGAIDVMQHTLDAYIVDTFGWSFPKEELTIQMTGETDDEEEDDEEDEEEDEVRGAKGFISGDGLWDDDLETAFVELHLDEDEDTIEDEETIDRLGETAIGILIGPSYFIPFIEVVVAIVVGVLVYALEFASVLIKF